MNKMNGMIVASIIGLASISQAMVPPWYYQVLQFDAAVEAVAERYNTTDQAADADALLVSSIVERADDTFLVTTDKAVCVVELVVKELNNHNGKPMPIGGIPAITGKVTECTGNKAALKTVTYEKISAKMDKAAAKGNFILAASVNAKGTIKLTYKTKDN